MSELQALNAKPSSCYLANVRLAKLWLARCWINHPRCIQLQIPRMPNRLVDVGPPDGSRDPILVTPTVLSRYVALSHCWGRGSIAMTTTKNIAEREAGIPMASLSKTFQEAIQVTRVFGIRYIWIDSLCILQDSVEEWEYEAAGMGRTYGNALFTIAAANASSGEEGLFPNQDHRLHTPCALKSLDNRPSTEFPMQCIHVVHPVDDKPAGHTAPKGPLFDRAWVLQEEIISHATLSFTGHGMYWNCVGYQANYSDPAANPGLYIPRPIRDAIGYYSQSRAVYQDDEGVKAMSNEKVTINFVKGGPKLMLSSEGIEALYKNWSTLVEEYYKRSITYPSDRLPALAGIAQNLQSTLQGRESPRGKWRPFPAYIGGVWSTDLQRGLLWSPHNYETWLRDHFDSDVLFTAEVSAWRIKPPQLFIGPSVSWCSMLESPVRWNGIYDKGWEGPDKICYIEIKQWSYGSDWKLFGPYWDATLELTCLLRIADIRKGEFLHDPSQDRRRIGRLLKDEIGELPDQIFLMPVLCEPIITMKSWNIYCLALVKTGLNENEYRRVGLAFIAYPNWFGNEIPRVIKMV
ncbi:heterokaryon incompatibility protein-domain-containing protein [Tricladium varicosporioides]|nr:heterokaryon incompatibility protein-domain-containing protein [Hymenoscyphus varicosporioides]